MCLFCKSDLTMKHGSDIYKTWITDKCSEVKKLISHRLVDHEVWGRFFRKSVDWAWLLCPCPWWFLFMGSGYPEEKKLGFWAAEMFTTITIILGILYQTLLLFNNNTETWWPPHEPDSTTFVYPKEVFPYDIPRGQNTIGKHLTQCRKHRYV